MTDSNPDSTLGLIERAIQSLAGQHTPETNKILELLNEAHETQVQVQAAYRELYKKMLRGGQ